MTERAFFLDLAARGVRMPVGVDLILHEEPDPEAVLVDGARLGRVVERAARHWGVPVALPLMDLQLEKASLLAQLSLAGEDAEATHLQRLPPPEATEAVEARRLPPSLPRYEAQLAAIRHIAANTSLLPAGMVIGPFSLMTKMLADPISAVALAARGLPPAEDPSVALMEGALRLSRAAVRQSVAAQLEAGARAVMICEPAANRVYLSPRSVRKGEGIFEEYVIRPNLELKEQIEAAGASLLFHNCGELTDLMVQEFATRLRPVLLSLGSSRRLWEDARLVPKDVVLYGNLPTKNFYSDAAAPLERVRELSAEICARMREADHPHILGSECDVLHVPEYATAIRAKVEAFVRG